MVDVDSGRAIQGCAEGMLETIDWAKLGIDRAKFIGADKYDCAVPTILYATVIAYDKDKMATTARRPSPICSTCRSSRASALCRRTPSSISNGP